MLDLNEWIIYNEKKFINRKAILLFGFINVCFVCNKKLIFFSFYFIMDEFKVDQIDKLSDLEKESSNKSSWKFCNEITLPRSEVVFFVQMFVILILITLCIIKLTVLKPTCEETSVWISFLSSLVGYILPNPRL